MTSTDNWWDTQPCPDCEAPAGTFCFRWCPRFDDERVFEDAQAGDDDDF